MFIKIYEAFLSQLNGLDALKYKVPCTPQLDPVESCFKKIHSINRRKPRT